MTGVYVGCLRKFVVARHGSVRRRPCWQRRGNRRRQRVRLAEGEGLLECFAQTLCIDRLRGRKQREVGQVFHARVRTRARSGRSGPAASRWQSSVSRQAHAAVIPDMTRSRSGNDFVTVVGVVFFIFFGFLIAPGVLTVFAVDRALQLHLDRGQLLVFGGVASLLEYFVISLGLESDSAFGTYLALCAATAGLLAVSYWGFHAHWPEALFCAVTGQ